MRLGDSTRRAVLVAHIARTTGLAEEPIARAAPWWPVVLGIALVVLAWWVK